MTYYLTKDNHNCKKNYVFNKSYYSRDAKILENGYNVSKNKKGSDNNGYE